ncbi:MAG: hypothetical protein AB2806_08905 [Candidatus Thiodiazotropha sp.]
MGFWHPNYWHTNYWHTNYWAAAAAATVLTADPGAYVLTGIDAALRVDRQLAADPGAYAIVGLDATLLVSGNAVLSAEPGTYVLTGLDAALTANIAPTGYPDLPLDNDSERKPVNMTATNLTAAGTVRQRNFQNTEQFEFTAKHSLLTQAEAESVYTLWSNNKSNAIEMVWAKDNVTYSVRFKGPPVIDRHKGNLWFAQAELIGAVA